ncbi:MAG: CHAD domain-containing protein [Bacteroidota bacterium]
MDSKRILNITSNHYRKLGNHLNKILPGIDSTTIHEFRVEYKKLRALLRLLSQQPGIGNEIKISRGLKKVYVIAGSLRDLQLQQQRIIDATKEAPKKPNAYLHLLQKEIEKLKPELSELISEKPIKQSKRKTDAAIPQRIEFSHLSQFVQKKWASIDTIIMSGNFSDENIHAIRKILKDLYYNDKFMNAVKKEIDTDDKGLTRRISGLDKLLEELGSFQDKCTSVALLKSYWIIQLNSYNQNLLSQLKKTWIREKVNRKQELIKKIKTALGESKI